MSSVSAILFSAPDISSGTDISFFLFCFSDFFFCENSQMLPVSLNPIEYVYELFYLFSDKRKKNDRTVQTIKNVDEKYQNILEVET